MSLVSLASTSSSIPEMTNIICNNIEVVYSIKIGRDRVDSSSELGTLGTENALTRAVHGHYVKLC